MYFFSPGQKLHQPFIINILKLIQHTSNERSLREISSAYSKKSLSDFGMKLSSDFSSPFLANSSVVDLKSASSTSL